MMDLFAYSQIDDLHELAQKNGIYIPRLRGYRLMENEKPVTEEDIKKMIQDCVVEEARNLCVSDWGRTSSHEYSLRTDRIRQKYLIIKTFDNPYHKGSKYEMEVGVRWERFHGKKRKLLKWAVRKAEKQIRAQYAVWNKYAGQKNVLYIHSRMGGLNWRYYDDKESIVNKPWFLDRVDDYYDNSYCDFYAKVNANNKEEMKCEKDDDHASD